MTVIRTHEDEHDLRNDADALDAIQVEIERDGASGADVVAVVDTTIAARKDDYGTGINTARPVVALLTTKPATEPEVFAGYWQPDGTWRDIDGRPGGVGLAQAISDEFAHGDELAPGAILTVTVAFQSFRGESPEPQQWDRESVGCSVVLPLCVAED